MGDWDGESRTKGNISEESDGQVFDTELGGIWNKLPEIVEAGTVRAFRKHVGRLENV